MKMDYIGEVKIKEWIEVRIEKEGKGRKREVEGGRLHVGERTVARASAVFAVPMN